MSDLLILANRVRDWVEKQPDLDVLTFVSIDENGSFLEEVRSYQQLWMNGQKLANWMKSRGMKKGDAFALVMANHPEFVEFMVASSILGTVFVPIDSRTKGEKLRYMLDFVQCKGAVVAAYALDNVEAQWGDKKDTWIAALGADANRPDTVESILASPLSQPELTIDSDDPDAAMQMLFTSGTTGDPKAILSSHRRFGEVSQLASMLGLTPQDRPYTGLSLTHANAQLVTLGNAITLGMRAVISRKFTKSRLWDITRHYGCTFFNLLGGMTTAIYAEVPKENDADNPVRRILSAGMPAAIWENFSRRFDVELFEFYGAAEGGMTMNPPGTGPIGSCGKPLASLEMKLFDEGGGECAVGEAGEICFRNADGTAPVVNYFKNPDASIKKTEGGWLRMGDIGHLDADGWLFFHYRKGGGIRRNGDFINPAFVEKALSELEAIADVFVYGVPMANGAPGEKDVVAAIVPADASTFDAHSVYRHCQLTLEKNCIPLYLQMVDEIPKTASEKPQERFLLDVFEPNASNVIPFMEKNDE
jgi:carnitine-CoA ligase